MPWQRKGSIPLQELSEDISSPASSEHLTASLEKSRAPSVDSHKEDIQRLKAANQSSTARLHSPEAELGDGDEASHYLYGFKLYLIIIGLSLSVLLVALVRPA